MPKESRAPANRTGMKNKTTEVSNSIRDTPKMGGRVPRYSEEGALLRTSPGSLHSLGQLWHLVGTKREGKTTSII